jgi:hypothetical protein
VRRFFLEHGFHVELLLGRNPDADLVHAGHFHFT